MLQTIKGMVSYVNTDTVKRGNKSWDVVRMTVKTQPSGCGKGRIGNVARISQINLTVFDKDLCDAIMATGDYKGEEPIVANDFVEVLMGDAIVNGNFINGQAHDVVWIEEHAYVAPTSYRDVDNAPHGKLPENKVEDLAEEDE